MPPMQAAVFLIGSTLTLAVVASGCGDDSSASEADPMAQGGEAGDAASSSGGELSSAGAESGGAPNFAGEDAGGGGGATPGPCMLGSEWTVVDDFVHVEGLPTNVVGVAADQLGNVYAVGLGRSMDKPVGVLRRSTDAGETWVDLPWSGALPNDIATDGAGNVFVTAGTSAAAVLKSGDRGDTFDSVLDIPTSAGSETDPCNTGFVATGPAGTVVAGASCDSTGWVIAKSTDGGDNWDTAFTFQLSAGKTARLQDVGVDAFGRAYAIGSAIGADDTLHWVTVREGEPTGIVSDDFQLEAGLEAQARGFSSHGAPIVVGYATDADGTHGIVRRQISVDAWETIEQFAARASDVEAVGAELVVSGEAEDGDLISVTTRRSGDSGLTWHPLDAYELFADTSTFSGQLAADASGNVYAGVAGRDEHDVPHWIIRKLACR
jgi:hypothetical protein